MSEEKRSTKINLNRMKSGEFVRTLWVATVEQGVTKKDIMEPSFWSHVAAQFRPYDRIEVRVDDGLFFSELLVLACDRTWAKVFELNHYQLTNSDVSMTQAETEMAEFEIKWKGPVNKFCVIRKSDDQVIKKELESKDLANAFLANYKKTIAA
ncbi:MAG: hypothetical protein PVI03_05480 [Candidatus Thorarchaeota archaeon]|jgi:hypothetical protein